METTQYRSVTEQTLNDGFHSKSPKGNELERIRAYSIVGYRRWIFDKTHLYEFVIFLFIFLIIFSHPSFKILFFG